MKYTTFAILAAVGLVIQLAAPANVVAGEPAATTSGTSRYEAELIERGSYLVTTAACHDCHTPWKVGPQGPEPDMTRMLSGHPQAETMLAPATLSEPWDTAMSSDHTAWSGPWGVSFTANLTPDDETGLGKWTAGLFRDTIRSGRHKGRGRELLPPMPIPMYRNFSDDDLNAIFAFLQSIPAVSNKVREPLPPTAQVIATN